MKRTGGNTFLAEDICSQAFLEIINTWSGLNKLENFTALLKWIAGCRYKDHIRNKQRYLKYLACVNDFPFSTERSIEDELILAEQKAVFLREV